MVHSEQPLNSVFWDPRHDLLIENRADHLRTWERSAELIQDRASVVSRSGKPRRDPQQPERAVVLCVRTFGPDAWREKAT